MKSLKYVFSLAIVAALGSCKKQVDLQPTDVIGSNIAFQNVNDLNSGALGVYGTWQQRRPVYLSAILSDEVRQGTGSEYRGSVQYCFVGNTRLMRRTFAMPSWVVYGRTCTRSLTGLIV